MSENYTLVAQKKGIVAIQGAYEDLRLTLIYRHHLTKPSNPSDSGVPDTTGAYILCSQIPDEDGHWRCYVGKSAEGGLSSRLQTHVISPKSFIADWTAAVLLHKTDGFKLNQDAASALEHFLWEMLNEKSGVKLANEKRPTGNPQIPIFDVDKLKHVCRAAVEFLPMIGVNVSSAAKANKSLKAAETSNGKNQPEPAPASPKKQAHNPEKISDFIQAGLLKIGDVLEPATQGKFQGSIKAVIHDAHGTIKIVELHGRNIEYQNLTYNSLSGATEPVVTADNTPNGWIFWKVQRTGKTLKAVREEYRTL